MSVLEIGNCIEFIPCAVNFVHAVEIAGVVEVEIVENQMMLRRIGNWANLRYVCSYVCNSNPTPRAGVSIGSDKHQVVSF